MATLFRSIANRNISQHISSSSVCEVCGIKPKYVENGYQHPYCGRSCARAGPSKRPNAPLRPECLLPGCPEVGQHTHDGFCSDIHGRDAVRMGHVQGCRDCRVSPRVNNEGLCRVCNSSPVSSKGTPRLQELDNRSQDFRNVSSRFCADWMSQTSAPTVEKVYQITEPRDVRRRHGAYKQSLGEYQEIPVYHSSQCICDMGTKGPSLCDFQSCGICMIVKSSFNELAFGVPYNTGRLGNGIYTYRDSSKADAHSTSTLSSPYRVMITCNLIMPASKGKQTSWSSQSPLVGRHADAVVGVYVIMYSMQ